MTIIESRTTSPGGEGQIYRAKDIEMAARIDVNRRLVLVTGAIDTNEHDILVQIPLPAAGTWHIIKAETNLTSEAWCAWQISFGSGVTVSPAEGALACRQLERVYVSEARDRVTFYEGEIRPGEAILKIYTVDTTMPEIRMSHSRCACEIVAVQSLPLEGLVKQGLPQKPFIEATLPVEYVSTGS